jgi:hypothetical protein
VNTSRDVTTSRHHYEIGLPQEDWQNELEVFPIGPPPRDFFYSQRIHWLRH